jgi:translation initiation factor IF-3
LNRPFSRHSFNSQPLHRVNGKIRAREVRVIGVDGQQVGVLELQAAIKLALQNGVDLVEVAATATPPVCRLVDYGKFKYELAKKERDSKKHQHANQVKEIQLSARIDPHDLKIKMEHAIGFLCEDMKVKVALRFRGREMAHTEIGFGVVNKFLADVQPWGHPDSPPKLSGKTINVMLSPQPKNKRAKNPKTGSAPEPAAAGDPSGNGAADTAKHDPNDEPAARVPIDAAGTQPEGFNSPFAKLDVPVTDKAIDS